jgi:hypothetical protein
MITYNAKCYNGDENDITEDAAALIERIHQKIRPLINDKVETALAKKL